MLADEITKMLENFAKRIRALETLDIRLYVGLRIGPRAGSMQQTSDDGDKVYVVEVTNALNEPIVSFGTIDDGDAQSAWASVGYGGYPQLHMIIHPDFDRKIPELDYVTAVPGDWNTAPTTVREALDELAARLKAAGH